MDSPRPGKVVLIGYRAAGKTTVGRLLAARLGWSYVDVDRGIEEHCRLTIREIIERHGEPFYRDVESEVVVVLCAGAERVVAFGAGTPMRARNREHARRDSPWRPMRPSCGGGSRRTPAAPPPVRTSPAADCPR